MKRSIQKPRPSIGELLNKRHRYSDDVIAVKALSGNRNSIRELKKRLRNFGLAAGLEADLAASQADGFFRWLKQAATAVRQGR